MNKIYKINKVSKKQYTNNIFRARLKSDFPAKKICARIKKCSFTPWKISVPGTFFAPGSSLISPWKTCSLAWTNVPLRLGKFRFLAQFSRQAQVGFPREENCCSHEKMFLYALENLGSWRIFRARLKSDFPVKKMFARIKKRSFTPWKI